MRRFGRKASTKMKCEPCPADFLVDSRFDLEDLGLNAYILHTPGHTSGSMSVIVGDEIAIVGDTMVGTFPRSIFPPFADDVPELIRSWGKLLHTGCRIFLPAHGSANGRELVEKAAGKRAKI
jgi:glyoxylase-like metal-dependent hydrolase (beta-lactamase superfamily II)